MPMGSYPGISSYNELFAMKKNLAFDAQFQHRMSAMSRDYYNRRENMRQEIRGVYKDLKGIQLSTGHSLNKINSAHGRRKINPPTIYLPPIGVRLVKKYVGLDFKRMSVDGQSANQRRLSSVLTSVLNLPTNVSAQAMIDGDLKGLKTPIVDKAGILKHKKVFATEVTDDELKPNSYLVPPADIGKHNMRKDVSFAIPSNAERGDDNNNKNKPSDEHQDTTGFGDSSVQVADLTNAETLKLPPMFKLQRELPLEDTFLIENREEMHKDDINDLHDDVTDIIAASDNIYDKAEGTELGVEYIEDNNAPTETEGAVSKLDGENNDVAGDATMSSGNVTDRASETKTNKQFLWTRSSSHISLLSEYNMRMIGLGNSGKSGKGNKTGNSRLGKTIGKFERFYLDYGDGILHDIMQIPKMKDCARPWCNPHCKTCRNRVTRRPCFRLVPAKRDDVLKKNQALAMDKQRAASTTRMYEIGREAKQERSLSNLTDDVVTKKRDMDASHGEEGGRDTGVTEDNDDTASQVREGTPNAFDVATFPMQSRPNKIPIKKTYNRARLVELAKPKGRLPSEVRFSKTSLRREQEEIVANESNKMLSKLEEDNLTYIQGKISVFLACLNQQEVNAKPTHMVDIPVREDIAMQHTPRIHMLQTAKRSRNKAFHRRH